MNENKELLRVENLHKSFPGVKALKGVQFQVLPGEVHALVGENGAGKSTFIKCCMGVYKKDAHSGEIFIDGESVDIANPDHAMKLGLGAVYQDVMMARHLTVAENFFLGNLPHRMGVVDWRYAAGETEKVLKELDIDVDSKPYWETCPLPSRRWWPLPRCTPTTAGWPFLMSLRLFYQPRRRIFSSP